MALYDLMVLVDSAIPAERREAIAGEIEAMISSGGSVVGVHDWGSRKLAYEMDHRSEAAYHLFQFEAGNDLLDRLSYSLKVMDGVLRFRIIRQLPGAPEAPPSPEPAQLDQEAEGDGRVAARAAADAPPE